MEARVFVVRSDPPFEWPSKYNSCTSSALDTVAF
jgi:hypothetical protein